jgi:SAM-dependent methyltransferase
MYEEAARLVLVTIRPQKLKLDPSRIVVEPALIAIWALVVLAVVSAAISLGWRWASRRWSLPCPSSLAWFLESPFIQRFNGTRITLDWLELQPGMKVLEIGPGPGRLLIPAAKRILPHGKAVGIDIQPSMIQRLRVRADRAGIENLSVILGDAAQPHFMEASFDLVFLCTVLGEIPDRAAALTRCQEALKLGGRLCVTEMIGDPHYQSRSTVCRLAEAAGFRLQSIKGGWLLFTADFIKPG